MTREQAAEFIKEQSPGAFLPKAKKRGFVCPLCGNGTGADGDGIVKNPKDGRYYCFKCGEVRGDIFDLIGAAFGLPDFNSRFSKGAEIYDVTVDRFAPIKKERGKKNPPLSPALSADVSRNNSEKIPKNISNGGLLFSESPHEANYTEKCHQNVHMTDYFEKRGIGEGLIKKFRLGFDPEFAPGGGTVWQAAVLPTAPGSYEVRNINVSPDSKGGDKYRKRGRAAVFNLSAVFGRTAAGDGMADVKPVFVCEGIFDALSVAECGGEAVALGSAANWRLLVSETEKQGCAVPLILLLDNDEAGKNAAKKLSEALTAAGVYFIDGSEALGGCHDPNARLLSDRAGFAEAVKGLEEKCTPLSEDIQGTTDREFEQACALSCLPAFRALIKKSAETPVCGTGFPSLDRALGGGLYPGLYVFGAASSVGKTTFMLQIADNAASSGRQALFFSLEQSRFELMAKSVSRESFLYCRENHLSTANALSSLDVSDGGRQGGFGGTKRLVMENAFGRYEKYAKNLFLYEGRGGMSPEDIKDHVRKFMTFMRPAAPPLVIVDYIQILSPGGGKMSDKQAMDRNVTALKQLSGDFDLPLLAVSSFNRMSYSQPVSMEAFKESGAIEYGADILAGLQPRGVGTAGFDITSAKAKDPRETELIILKNRSGAVPSGAVRFTYFPQFNCYEE